MKTIFNKIAILLSVIFAMSSCGSEDMNYKDAKVTAVNKLYEPTNKKTVKLTAGASLFFEWEASKSEDSGALMYEVVFDKEGGDFSKPLYRVIAQNGGFSNNALIPHTIVNKAAAAAGIEAEATGTIIWTVLSSRGINEIKANESRELIVTRMAGFTDVPDALYITGEAVEGGLDLASSLPCKILNPGVFEVFAKLEAGKKYKFTDRKNGEPSTFSVIGSKLVSGGETTVPLSGIFRLKVDFSTAAIEVIEIKTIGLWFCPDKKVLWNLNYIGKGVWEGEGLVVFKQEDWGRDERYKFQSEIINESGTTAIKQWGTKIGTDSKPTSDSPESYYFVKEVATDQWNDKWKFTSEMDNSTVKITIYFQGDKEYTHSVVKK